jgi:hypothetical protein
MDIMQNADGLQEEDWLTSGLRALHEGKSVHISPLDMSFIQKLTYCLIQLNFVYKNLHHSEVDLTHFQVIRSTQLSLETINEIFFMSNIENKLWSEFEFSQTDRTYFLSSAEAYII